MCAPYALQISQQPVRSSRHVNLRRARAHHRRQIAFNLVFQKQHTRICSPILPGISSFYAHSSFFSCLYFSFQNCARYDKHTLSTLSAPPYAESVYRFQNNTHKRTAMDHTRAHSHTYTYTHTHTRAERGDCILRAYPPEYPANCARGHRIKAATHSRWVRISEKCSRNCESHTAHKQNSRGFFSLSLSRVFCSCVHTNTNAK